MIDKELLESLRSMVENTPRSNLKGSGSFRYWSAPKIAKDRIQDYDNQPNDLGAYMQKIYSYFNELWKKHNPEQVRQTLDDFMEPNDYETNLPYLNIHYDVDNFIKQFNELQKTIRILSKYRNKNYNEINANMLHRQLERIIHRLINIQETANNLIRAIKNHCSTHKDQIAKILYKLAKLPKAFVKFIDHIDLINFIQSLGYHAYIPTADDFSRLQIYGTDA